MEKDYEYKNKVNKVLIEDYKNRNKNLNKKIDESKEFFKKTKNNKIENYKEKIGNLNDTITNKLQNKNLTTYHIMIVKNEIEKSKKV